MGGRRLYGGGAKSDTAGRVANDKVIAFDVAEVQQRRLMSFGECQLGGLGRRGQGLQPGCRVSH